MPVAVVGDSRVPLPKKRCDPQTRVAGLARRWVHKHTASVVSRQCQLINKLDEDHGKWTSRWQYETVKTVSTYVLEKYVVMKLLA
jgi:hypothetical protein